MSMIFYSTHHHYFQTETNTFKGPTFVMTEVDGRAWWAAVYGVEQSRTRLKRLSSSSSSSLPRIPTTSVCVCFLSFLN